jgi:hypothetical protein
MADLMFRRYSGLACAILATLLAGCVSVKYSPVVTAQKTIPGVAVKVSYKADGIYQVQVVSNLRGKISLLWNNSAYRNTAGDAVRLIQITDPEHFPDAIPKQQAPSLIARGVNFKTYFVGETWLDFARRGVSPRPKDSEGKAGIYLAFSIKGKKVYWKGEVNFVPVKQ